MLLVVCYHSGTYKFTSKLKKGVGKLTKPVHTNKYARENASISKTLAYLLAVSDLASLPAPLFRLSVKCHYVAMVKYKVLLISWLGAVAGL